MKNLKYYLKKAEKEGWAIGQFNFSNLKILKAIIRAAVNMKAPLILGTSEGESRSLGLGQAVALVNSYKKETLPGRSQAKLPIFLNLDHGKSFLYIKKAIIAGYDAVHFDGSKLSLKDNIRETKKVVNYAKKFGVLVEGEVGIMGTESSKIYKESFKIKEENLTRVGEAVKFLNKTKVDSLAVNIGNFHGIEKRGRNPRLKIERLNEIKKKTCKTPLVLHGGSGTAEKDIKEAIKKGIVKININTDLRVAYTTALKKTLKKKPKETTPHKYMKEVVIAVQKVVEKKIKLFGSNNKI